MKLLDKLRISSFSLFHSMVLIVGKLRNSVGGRQGSLYRNFGSLTEQFFFFAYCNFADQIVVIPCKERLHINNNLDYSGVFCIFLFLVSLNIEVSSEVTALD